MRTSIPNPPRGSRGIRPHEVGTTGDVRLPTAVPSNITPTPVPSTHPRTTVSHSYLSDKEISPLTTETCFPTSMKLYPLNFSSNPTGVSTSESTEKNYVGVGEDWKGRRRLSISGVEYPRHIGCGDALLSIGKLINGR
ncbi:hypothetical protein B296_00007476 [Ensete ventricosum]|uniref:Uncharacterized protein n=1 Tax=Ensete ventricosum TaxID=4639 RepID=A0A426ZXQ2_ENSVE|nr:hypothetical protein B296_00007476 [Ensete ventricosum]